MERNQRGGVRKVLGPAWRSLQRIGLSVKNAVDPHFDFCASQRIEEETRKPAPMTVSNNASSNICEGFIEQRYQGLIFTHPAKSESVGGSGKQEMTFDEMIRKKEIEQKRER